MPICGEVCLAFVCVFYFFWLSASHDLRLGMDGMLLALCDRDRANVPLIIIIRV